MASLMGHIIYGMVLGEVVIVSQLTYPIVSEDEGIKAIVAYLATMK